MSEITNAIQNIDRLLTEGAIPKMQFYADVGLTPASVSAWKNGSSFPSFSTLLKIADYFGITVSALLATARQESESDKVLREYNTLDAWGQSAVRAIIREEKLRLATTAPVARRTKVIPLFGTAAAAGPGEPDTGNPWEDYEIAEDSPADFAVRISGDSMEPLLQDGSVALCRKGYPQIGDVVVVMVNGSLICKQFISDGKNIFLRSLNRRRKDCDYDIWAMGNDTIKCFGTVILKSRPPLVRQ